MSEYYSVVILIDHSVVILIDHGESKPKACHFRRLEHGSVFSRLIRLPLRELCNHGGNSRPPVGWLGWVNSPNEGWNGRG